MNLFSKGLQLGRRAVGLGQIEVLHGRGPIRSCALIERFGLGASCGLPGEVEIFLKLCLPAAIEINQRSDEDNEQRHNDGRYGQRAPGEGIRM